jgi:hypothetical protein
MATKGRHGKPQLRRWQKFESQTKRLRFGTAKERIGDESLTRTDSGFVHRYIFHPNSVVTPDSESGIPCRRKMDGPALIDPTGLLMSADGGTPSERTGQGSEKQPPD